MKKTVAIIVPHQDDELIMMGAFWDKLCNYEDVFIIFSTNGDYDLKTDVNYRLREAIKAAGYFGIKDSNIIFCGYGDNWKGTHIYNSDLFEVKESMCGRTKTYGLEEHQDYHCQKYGTHIQYTRENYLNDMISIIKELLPDIIFCVDCDNHPDHIATSLFFEEALGIVLKEKSGYYPIVFKRFLYEGAWFGKSDYYLGKPTKISKNSIFYRFGYQLNNTSFTINDAIRINTSEEVYVYPIENSLLYKASKEYKSQPLYLKLHKVLNTDSLVWWRPTKNLMFEAEINVSSGEKKYLNDFKIVDCKDVKNNTFDKYLEQGWIPDKEDKEKKIEIRFNTPKIIQEIRLYEILSLTSHITKCEMIFDNNYSVEIGKLKNKAGCNVIKLESPINDVKYVEFRITNWKGERPGIAEMELYSEIQNSEYAVSWIKNNERSIKEEKKYIRNFVCAIKYNAIYFFKFKLYFAWRKIKNYFRNT